MALQAAAWPRAGIDALVAINNACLIRPDWDYAIYPWDFPPERHPVAGPGQRLVTEADFVPAQNAYGGFVYAGATMAYTAAYWALAALRPQVIGDVWLRYALSRDGADAFLWHRQRPTPCAPTSPCAALRRSRRG